jgi:hypothetical protein
MTVDDIKQAIAGLPGEERHSLAVWLNELEYDDWDKEMLKDFSPGGRGYHFVEKVQREIAVRSPFAKKTSLPGSGSDCTTITNG